jgi:methylenetetrahydrofolate--tRNA-(uracil-5-)-methyltransferase
MSERVTIIGGGLAGCEAAFQLARRGVPVDLYEMRPVRRTEAHTGDRLGELVCSNSFRNATLETAVGLLKEEMRRLGSLVMRVADGCRVPAGACLAVDRDLFAGGLTQEIEALENVRLVREEVTTLPDGVVIIATGPLTVARAVGRARTDARHRAPLFLRRDRPHPDGRVHRHGRRLEGVALRKGGEDYINCPFDRAGYYAFVDAVLAAEKVPTRDFERCIYFEGCMPIEEMARRGPDTLAFGPMRPVGLVDPRDGKRPFACVQLRQDDADGRLYNMVGFQTKMTYPEQRRVFRMIPGLAKAEFVRLGSLHRNTFVNSPALLLPTLQINGRKRHFLAGQLVGVEGTWSRRRRGCSRA